MSMLLYDRFVASGFIPLVGSATMTGGARSNDPSTFLYLPLPPRRDNPCILVMSYVERAALVISLVTGGDWWRLAGGCCLITIISQATIQVLERWNLVFSRLNCLLQLL